MDEKLVQKLMQIKQSLKAESDKSLKHFKSITIQHSTSVSNYIDMLEALADLNMDKIMAAVESSAAKPARAAKENSSDASK